MAKVLGSQCALLVNWTGGWQPISCSRSFTINTEIEDVETSNSSSGLWKTFKGKRLSWTVDFDGITLLNETLTFDQLRAAQFTMANIDIAILCTDLNGQNVTYFGKVLMSQLSETFNLDDVVTHTASLKGTGSINITYNFIPSGGNIMRIDYTLIGGESTLALPALINKNILTLDIDGLSYSRVQGAPTNNKEFSFDSTLGILDWGVPKDGGVQLVIIYQ